MSVILDSIHLSDGKQQDFFEECETQLTLYPSKAQLQSSAPSWHPGLKSALPQPTRIGPAVKTSNSKYLQNRRKDQLI